jgi:hypothetical protein
MQHGFQNICYFTRTYPQGAAKLTQNQKTRPNTSDLGKNTTQVNHCNWQEENMFKSISWWQYFQKHTRSRKEISLIRCFEHLFTYLPLMKIKRKQYWLSVISIFFYLHPSFIEKIFTIRFRGRPFNILRVCVFFSEPEICMTRIKNIFYLKNRLILFDFSKFTLKLEGHITFASFTSRYFFYFSYS